MFRALFPCRKIIAMSAISIIHAPVDAQFGDQIADALSRDGHQVKRRRSDRSAGDLGLEDELAIVVWSQAAASLARIHAEAREALARGALIPIAIGATPPPRGFEDIQPVDLSGWAGDLDDPRWRFVLGEINVAAHRNILEDGAVWPDPASALPPEPARVPASAIISDADWPPENDGDEFDDVYLEDVNTEAEFQAPEADYVVSRPPSRIRPVQVAIGASLGLVALTAGAAFLAPVFLSPPERVAGVTRPPVISEDASPTIDDAAPATLAFVKPVTIEGEGRSLDNQPTDGNSNASVPPIADRLDTVLAAANAPTDGQNEVPVTAPDEDAMAELVAAVTVEDAPTDELEPLASHSPHDLAGGEYFKDCDSCPEMALLPAGGFSMGSPQDEPARLVSEGPVTGITISGGFALGAREVTFGQWQACVDEGGCKGYAPFDHEWGRGDRPVIGISYEDAQSYADWLKMKTGHAYRLPSEAEWEYAARAGSSAPFSFGYTVSTDQANFNGEHAYGAPEGVNRARTTTTASFEPNGFGLFDMHGNVWEWTADCWTDGHGDQRDRALAPAGVCRARVLKGGAWNTGGWRLRSAHRIGKDGSAREYDNGFRVARDMD